MREVCIYLQIISAQAKNSHKEHTFGVVGLCCVSISLSSISDLMISAFIAADIFSVFRVWKDHHML